MADCHSITINFAVVHLEQLLNALCLNEGLMLLNVESLFIESKPHADIA